MLILKTSFFYLLVDIVCGDEEKLKREVVNKVAHLTPSNQPFELKQPRVGLEQPIHAFKCWRVWLLGGIIGLGGGGWIWEDNSCKRDLQPLCSPKEV
jgi:hypothetical protein